MVKGKPLADVIKDALSKRDDVLVLGTFEKVHEIDYEEILRREYSGSNTIDRYRNQTNIYIVSKEETSAILKMDKWFKDVISSISSNLSSTQKVVTFGCNYVRGGYYSEYKSRPKGYMGGEYWFILKPEEFSEYVDVIELIQKKSSSKELEVVGSVAPKELSKLKKSSDSKNKKAMIKIKLFDHVYVCPLLNKKHYDCVSAYPDAYPGEELCQEQIAFYLKEFNLADE